MAKHAAEENMVEMEETEMERKRRDAEPVVRLEKWRGLAMGS